MITYRPLLRVDVRHEFHRDGICPALSFIQTPETARLIASRGMVFRATTGGFAIFRPDDRDADDDLVFTVVMQVADPAFANYTDLDGASSGAWYLFDRARAPNGTDDSVARLHEEPWVSASERMAPDTGQLLASLTGRVWAVPPLGVVRVSAGGNPAPAADSGERYGITFRARRTLWKYYVLGAPASGVPPAISDPDGVIEFESTGAESLAGNREAITLRSTAPIALQERPAHRFQLRVKTTTGERVLVRRLAVASPNHLGKDTIDGHEVTVSEIYINL
ncbi:MAG: hypothetical protein GC151_04355 [Betaproteobacteria bacterium]|nr:hypothetical protein [Betaproteobacteria bacterium]